MLHVTPETCRARPWTSGGPRTTLCATLLQSDYLCSRCRASMWLVWGLFWGLMCSRCVVLLKGAVWIGCPLIILVTEMAAWWWMKRWSKALQRPGWNLWADPTDTFDCFTYSLSSRQFSSWETLKLSQFDICFLMCPRRSSKTMNLCSKCFAGESNLIT